MMESLYESKTGPLRLRLIELLLGLVDAFVGDMVLPIETRWSSGVARR